MTFEQRRLARLERMASLFVTATLRERRMMLEQSERINILLNTQEKMISSMNERFNRNEERFKRNEERFERNEERFVRTDEKLQALIDAIRKKELGYDF